MSVAMKEIAGLVIGIGALAIMGLVAGFFATNAIDTAHLQKEESVDDPRSEEWTR